MIIVLYSLIYTWDGTIGWHKLHIAFCLQEHPADDDDILDSEEALSEDEDEGAEEEEEEVNSVDAETLKLGDSPKPAKSKKDQRTARPRKPVKESEVTEEEEKNEEMGALSGAQTMRALYWEVVHEAQKKIKRENPDMPPKDILKMARAEWLTCILKSQV